MLAIAIPALLTISIACSNNDTEDVLHTPTPITTVSPEIALIARQLTIAYLSDKPWGFFGATCDQWIEIDYAWNPNTSEQLPDGHVTVVFERLPERILGPQNLLFRVDVDSGTVQGDNQSDTSERLGVAEGCDKW